MKWTIEEASTPGLYDVYDEDGNRVVRHTTHDRARLIAAAPDLRAVLEVLVADERKFVTCYREAADSYFAICNFCGTQHNDEYHIEHEPDCPIEQARAALGAEAGE